MCDITFSNVYDGRKDGRVGEDGWGGGEKSSADLGTLMVVQLCLCLASFQSTMNVSFDFSARSKVFQSWFQWMVVL